MSGLDLSFLQDLPTYLPNEEPEPTESLLSKPESSHGVCQKEEENRSVDDNQKVIRIPGTNITLQTEEDIRKWIEERKRNWPSEANIRRKKEARQQGQEQTKIEQNNSNIRKRLPEESELSSKRGKSLCRNYQQYKKCKFGDKCRNVHEIVVDPNPIANGNANNTTHYRRIINGINTLIPKLYSNRTQNTPTSNSSLFKHLITSDQMSNENMVIIDFIKYLDEKGLIDHEVMKDRK
ncbi:hypothetical protein KGF56_003245 [Candida oxycetoniae]|uniref:C3H1-type domain-containing protein n=1 Tax=Candida oxycetoniae TaxID=497107 RepID=A0AAI9SVR1_9ASCO|nr:uncharacterized protein KGF56_003245 [Candida oxycetoniae]KAI3403978.2 hypothetical protein KGF56_003245 [Candida oxycetoniae]